MYQTLQYTNVCGGYKHVDMTMMCVYTQNQLGLHMFKNYGVHPFAFLLILYTAYTHYILSFLQSYISAKVKPSNRLPISTVRAGEEWQENIWGQPLCLRI